MSTLTHLPRDDDAESLEQAKRVAYEKGSMACKDGVPRDANGCPTTMYTPQENAAWDLGWAQTAAAIDEARKIALHAGKHARRAGLSYCENPYDSSRTDEDAYWNTGWLEEDAILKRLGGL